MEQVEIGLDPVEQPVADHVVAKLDGRRKALVVGAAMALHDDAVQAEEHAAIGLAHVHLLAQPVEGALGEDIADPRHQRAAHRGLADRTAIWRAVPSAVFSAMLPAKPSVTTTSTVPLPMSSPSTKP